MKRTDKTLATLATSLPSTTDILRGSLLQRRIRLAPAAPCVPAAGAISSPC